MSADQNEYIVRVPSDTKKQFHVMRFSAALNVDVTKLKNCKLERELTFKEVKEQQEEEQYQQQQPEFGAGSEFGRKEKDEARRRKFERRKNKQNNSPWILKVGGKHGKKYRGIREGGVTENVSYYVFFQASDGMFEAFPVNEWYNFTPFQRYKALSAEEAEEKFIKRDQILNFFQLRNMAKTKGESDKDDSSKKSERKIKKEFKVSDMDDWYDMSENEDSMSGDDKDDSDEDNKQRKSKKDKGKKEKKKIKKEESDGEEPLEDSDEGDYDDKEVDYMSDESSSSESEEEKVDLKGVADESALRDLVVSEEEEEEEQDANKDENQEQNDDANNKFNESDKSKSIKSERKSVGNGSSSESDFDSENSDIDESSKSALLIQSSKNNKSQSATAMEDSKSMESLSGTKRKLEQDSSGHFASSSSKDDNSSNSKSNGLKFKHKLENPIINEQSMAKKMKVKHSDSGITEEAVRRYLIRKPMTAADLVQKFKNKTAHKEKIPDLLAEILRKINPEKQNIKGKIYFSLKPT